jgi:Fe-S cluster assembly protein SufD
VFSTLTLPSPDAALPPVPDWLASCRADALRRLHDAAPPNSAAEEWRYSDVDDVELESVAFGAGPGPSVRVEGPALDGVTVGAASEFDGPAADSVAQALASTLDDGDPISLVSLVGLSDPLVIDVAPGRTVPEPIRVTIPVGDGIGAHTAAVVVRAGANSDVEVVVSSDGDDVESLEIVRIVVDVASAARVRIAEVCNVGSRVRRISSVVGRVERDASLSIAHAALGGAATRTRFDARLVGRGASGDLRAVYLGTGDQRHDLRTFQRHEAPDTSSNLVFKGALDGRSRAVYTGLIHVGHDARGTNATQSNRIIKLSDDTWAESVPNLEIHHNDVRCAHASAVGPIDEDQRFYLESRGVPPEVAERLVVAGFFEEVLGAFDRSGEGAALRSTVNERLGAGA